MLVVFEGNKKTVYITSILFFIFVQELLDDPILLELKSKRSSLYAQFHHLPLRYPSFQIVHH